MPFKIIRHDITKYKADAIVNTANPLPIVGSGTDSAIYQAAGKEKLLACRRNIGIMAPGEARETPAFDLPARYIIHTVGPVWEEGHSDEEHILRRCYDNCLQLASSLHCESIAFPLISTGAYEFPREKALKIALAAFRDFLRKESMEITLVVFDDESARLSAVLYPDLEKYITSHYVHETIRQEYQEYQISKHHLEGIRQSLQRLSDRLRGRKEEPVSEAPKYFGTAEDEERKYRTKESVRWDTNISLPPIRNKMMAEEDSFAMSSMDAKSMDAKSMDAEPMDAEPMDAEPMDAEPMEAASMEEAPIDAASMPSYTVLPMSAPASVRPASGKTVRQEEQQKHVPKTLEELLKGDQKSFQEKLMEYIQKRDLKPTEIYGDANIDRRLFSKILCNRDYIPNKRTVMALTIGLKLDMAEAKDLMGRAGYAFSPSLPFDLIVQYFIEKRDYNIYAINQTLFEYGQGYLGSSKE